MNNAIIRQKIEEFMIYISSTIIRPNSFDVFSKLILDKTKKFNKTLKDLIFMCPCDTSTIVIN